MSQKNVEVVRRWHEAFDRGDWDSALSEFAPDTIWDDRDFRPEGDVHQGLEAMAAVVRSWFEAWENYRWEVEKLLDAGDKAAVIGRERGKGEGSGVGVDQRLGMVATVRDGRIVHTKVFRDPEDALEAVGLQE